MENERINPNVKKWYTLSEYVDIDTGEILTREAYGKLIPLNKKEVDNLNYIKIRYEKTTEIIEQYNSNRTRERIGYTKYTNLVRKSAQGRLF